MQLSHKFLLVLVAALLGALCVSAVQPRMAPVPIVSTARLAEIRGDALTPADPAAEEAAEDADEESDEGADEEESSNIEEEEEESEEESSEEGGSDAGESTSDGLVVAAEEKGRRLPIADVIGEAPHTNLGSDEVDQVARYVLMGARKSRCAGKGEYCDMVIKSCKDDDCNDKAEKEDKAAGESSEESSEDASSEESASGESEESKESESEESASSSGVSEESKESESEESASSAAAEESKESEEEEEASSDSGDSSSEGDEESSESEESSVEAQLSQAEQKALADLQK